LAQNRRWDLQHSPPSWILPCPFVRCEMCRRPSSICRSDPVAAVRYRIALGQWKRQLLVCH
jgi:hypothetical protein